jgi:CDP-6-deoxy-D-xylo-4-hexulose-3-dehydrase
MYVTTFDIEGNSNFALPLIIKDKTTNLQHICDILEKSGIEYRLGTIGGGSQLNQPYIINSEYKVIGDTTNSEYITHNSLYIGNHPEIQQQQILDICKKLNNI